MMGMNLSLCARYKAQAFHYIFFNFLLDHLLYFPTYLRPNQHTFLVLVMNIANDRGHKYYTYQQCSINKYKGHKCLAFHFNLADFFWILTMGLVLDIFRESSLTYPKNPMWYRHNPWHDPQNRNHNLSSSRCADGFYLHWKTDCKKPETQSFCKSFWLSNQMLFNVEELFIHNHPGLRNYWVRSIGWFGLTRPITWELMVLNILIEGLNDLQVIL